MPRRFGNYQALFDRIEEEFSIEDITSANLQDLFGVETPGRKSLAEQLSQVSEINKDIERIDTILELENLRVDVNVLPIKKQELLNKIDIKIQAIEVEQRELVIVEGIELVGDFAEERGIILSDVNIGRVEIWKDGKERLVIRGDDGRLKAWQLT